MDMKRLSLRATLAVAAMVTAACSDTAPPPGPGTLTATVVSPNGAEGAAIVEVFGPGIGDVGALEGRAHSEHRGDTVRVVIVRDDAGGGLRFTLAVTDTTQHFTGRVLEVAGPDDQLRLGVSAYSVEVRR